MPAALVLGATGFVGTHVVQALLERRQYRVYCLCRSSSAKIPSGAERVIGDVESAQTLLAAIESTRADYIFNLAGVYAWWSSTPDRFARVNTEGVQHLVDAARSCAQTVKKVIHVSTVLAYGNPKGRGLTPSTAFDEETPAGPHASLYAASKHAGDEIAQRAFTSGEVRARAPQPSAASPRAAVPCDRRPRASSTPRLPPPQVPGCTLFLACCIGADPKLNDAARDVMRIRELVLGQAPDLA